MWCLHDPGRWLPSPLLPNPSSRCHLATHHHHRRPREKRATPSRTASLPRRRCLPVRLLHLRHDHDQRRATRIQAQSFIDRNCQIAPGQHLPLRHSPSHYRGRRARCENDAPGAKRMSTTLHRPTADPARLQIEPERYEFFAESTHHFGLARRDFFKLLGAGIAVFSVAAKSAAATQETAPSRHFHNEPLPTDITAWLHV